MRLKSLQTKIVLWAGICLLVTAAIIVTYAVIEMRNQARTARETAVEHAKQYAAAVAQQHSNYIEVELEVALDAARTLAQALSGIRDEKIGLEIGRDAVNGMLRTVLEQNPRFVGVYTAWEPNAFDEMDVSYMSTKGHDKTGRFIPYWSRDIKGNIMVEPLVDYEAEGPGDYYQLPKKRKIECLIDPYIYPIQDEDVLITSLVVPIVVDDTFYGITGVDLRLDDLQELVDDVEHLYEGTAQIQIISHAGTLVAVTGKPALSGKHIQEIHEDWEQDLSLIQQGEAVVKRDEGGIGVFTPLKVGYTTTPWAVTVIVPEEKITETADAQMAQVLQEIWKMIGISIICAVVALILLWFVARSISGPILQAVGFAQHLAAGDLSADITIKQQDELGILANALQTMKDKIQNVLQDANMLIGVVQEGKLDVRGNADVYEGGWRELIVGMNTVIDAFMAPFNVTAEYLDRISKGDLPQKITEDYQGDFREVTNNLNQCIDAISGLVSETGTLTEAAVEGKLDVRGDTSQFGGEYAAIIAGVNNTIDTLVGHIDQLPVPVMILDPQFSIRYINKAGAKMAGLSKEQLAGQKCYEQFKTSDCQSVNCACAKAMHSGNIETSDTEAHPDGKDLLISYNGLPIRDQAGTIIGVVEILMDQTEIKQAMSAVEQQNWMRTGQAELANLMRGEQDAVTLAKSIITYLAKYLGVQTGAMYLINNQNGERVLQLSGSYAYAWRKGLNNAFRLGEGFVGQAALEQESIGYTDIPDDYLSVGSGLGGTKPKYVLVTPFMYEGDLKGVIEVGATEKLTETQLEFLNQAAETIAVAFHSAQTRQKMQDLLEQTQRQAEELQAQQEHVREQG